MSIEEAAQQAQANLCEDTLDNLTLTCRDVAKDGSGPLDLLLALCHVFGGISSSLHDRPVDATEIEALSDRLGRLLGIVKDQGVSEQSRARINDAFEELRDLV